MPKAAKFGWWRDDTGFRRAFFTTGDRLVRRRPLRLGAPENVEFIPAGIIEGPPPLNPAMLPSRNPAPRQQPVRATSKAGSIEIALANGSRVTVDTFVNEKALSRVLRAMQGLA